MRRRLLLALLALLATAGATRPAASDERALTALVEEELEGDGDEELGREAGIEADELREMPAHAWTPASSPRKHKHRCLFLHGTGLSPGRLTGLYTQLDSYWGSEVRRELDKMGCEAVFIFAETVHRGWDNHDLVRDYCGAIDTVKPTVVVTHSMGGLVVASGIHWKVKGCDRIVKAGEPRGPNGTVWLASQTPFRGAVSADYCAAVCPDRAKAEADLRNALETTQRTSGERSTDEDSDLPALHPLMEKFKVPRLLRWLSFSLCYCQGSAQRGSVTPEAIQSLETIYVSPHHNGLQLSCPAGQYKAQVAVNGGIQVLRRSSKADQAMRQGDRCVQASAIGSQYAHGILCGLSAWSIRKLPPSLGLAVASPVIHLIAPGGWALDRRTRSRRSATVTGNDGVVPFESCRADHPRSVFRTHDPKALFYAVRANHRDGTFRNGDATIDVDKDERPLSWLLHIVRPLLVA